MKHTNIIKASIFTPVRGGIMWGLPIMAWGQPGVAKTAVIEEICRKYGMPYETLSPSERGEGAFGVVPVPEAVHDRFANQREALAIKLMAGKKSLPEHQAWEQAEREFPRPSTLLEYPPPKWSVNRFPNNFGVIFVDEITSAAPALQAPLMGLILARRLGGYTFPPRVRVIGAANPVEMAAGGHELAAPLANRLGHLDWPPPTVEEHVQYMLRGASGNVELQKYLAEFDEDMGVKKSKDERAEEERLGKLAEANAVRSVEDEEARVLAAWPSAWAIAVGAETSFMRRKGAVLKNKMPDMGNAAVGRAWPSDRSWEMATHAYASSLVHNLSEQEQFEFVSAFIGAGAAGEWMAFITDNDIPNPAKVLDGHVKFSPDPTRLDRTIAVLQSCTALVVPVDADRRKDRAAKLWEIIGKMVDAGHDLDVLVPTARAMIGAGHHVDKVAHAPLGKLNPFLKKAGITGAGG